MAKIKTIKFDIKGKDYEVAINCTTKGLFTANVPQIVSDSLGIDTKIEKSTLNEVEKELYDNIHRYKTSKTTQDLYIGIVFSSSGLFNRDEKGNTLALRGKLLFDPFFNKEFDGVLGFGYSIIIKESVDGIESFYSTVYDYENYPPKDGDVKTYRKRSRMFNNELEKYILIEFSEEATTNLDMITEAIRKASHALFKFLNQDVELIQQYINSGPLLLNE